MKNLFLVSAHILATIAKLPGTGGVRIWGAENFVLKRQPLIPGRSR